MHRIRATRVESRAEPSGKDNINVTSKLSDKVVQRHHVGGRGNQVVVRVGEDDCCRPVDSYKTNISVRGLSSLLPRHPLIYTMNVTRDRGVGGGEKNIVHKRHYWLFICR